MAAAEEPSDQNKSALGRLRSNSYDQAVSDDHPEVKKTPFDPPKKPSENERHDDDDIYVIKWIEFNQERLPILLQNINGPCPLLALANILLLRKQVKISCMKLKEFYFL
jgi:hypothetical protein